MINGIPLDTFEDELLKFEPFSRAVSISIPEDRDSNTNRNYGFAEFISQQDAIECLTACRNSDFKGVRLNVRMQKTPLRYQFRNTVADPHRTVEVEEDWMSASESDEEHMDAQAMGAFEDFIINAVGDGGWRQGI